MSEKWTDAELEFLTRDYTKLTAAEMGKVLGRTKNATKNKRRELGLIKVVRVDPEIVVQVNRSGKGESVPPMPGLLESLISMTGSMHLNQIEKKDTRRDCSARIESVIPTIKRLLALKESGYKISKETGLPKSTVYRYIREMRAAARSSAT